jgi:maltose O-acetyltransferase
VSEAGRPPRAECLAGGNNSLRARLRRAWDLEFVHLWPRLLAFGLLARMLPEGRAAVLRTMLVRAIGVRIGKGTRFQGMPKMQSTRPGLRRARLRIGADCIIGTRVILEFGEMLTIGDRVSLAAGAVILTTSHQLGPREQRAGPAVSHPVTIGDDVEIGANSIVLPGVTLGRGARVLADSVVNANVAPGATVSGIPARPQRPA